MIQGFKADFKSKHRQWEPTVISFVHSRMNHYLQERGEEIRARDENYAENRARDENYTSLRMTLKFLFQPPVQDRGEMLPLHYPLTSLIYVYYVNSLLIPYFLCIYT